jgi:phage shock protein A
MPYFSRLTDIVTCNLSSILSQADDRKVALEEIVYEMKEGVAGAERSTTTAGKNVSRIEIEIGQQRAEVDDWMKTAQESMSDGEEAKARQALERKHEVEDLIAGLEQQLKAAISTRDHLRTMMHALQARLADATRRMQMIAAGENSASEGVSVETVPELEATSERQGRVDAELDALRKQMGVD